MKLYEITFWSGETLIQFGESKAQILRKWFGYGIDSVDEIIIH